MNHSKRFLNKDEELVAFMSIKPEFARKIVSGDKKYEYRKAPISIKAKHIIIYSTSPEKRIIGVAEVGEILSGSPTSTWEKTKNLSGTTRKFFREYFRNKKTAYAIKIMNILPLDNRIRPNEIRGDFKVPQSFCYVDRSFLKKLLCIGSKNADAPNELIFVGGIHGVGKSTLCVQAAEKLKFGYLSASSLIRQYKKKNESEIVDNCKRVKNISDNQDVLMNALDEVPYVIKPCLLDGHFALLDEQGGVHAIPAQVFYKIKPKTILVVVDDSIEIVKRLKHRDGIEYDEKVINAFQAKEMEQAQIIGDKLNIAVHKIQFGDFDQFVDALLNI